MVYVNGLRAGADALFARSGGLYPPSSVLTSWPRPNYANPETRGWAVPIVLIALLTFTFIVYSARMWARLMVAKNAGLDDLLMSIAMILVVGSTVAVILGIRTYGFQWHAWDQTPQTLITTRQITLAIEILYLESTTLIKISILCFYQRITNGSISKVFVYWVWASITSVVCYSVIFAFVITFSYTPVEAYWHLFDVSWRLRNELKGFNEGAVIVSVGVIGTLQDFFICALPIILVWNLQIPRRQKAALIGIFGMGLLTCVCGIMRTYYAIYIYNYTYDITWYAFYGWIWTALEADLGVICASAPALKVFFRRYFNFPANRSGNSGSGGRKTSAYNKARLWNPAGKSNMGSGRRETDIVPMDAIKVSTRHLVTIEDRDEVLSQASDKSTRNLTALPSAHLMDKSEPSQWVGCRTVCAAIRPDSQGSSRNKSWDSDIERYAESD
ncbi:hypothetical protein K469DRAFT_603311 [Zopfia rhizophila CBS 207.26]|uniref:Rhodopsin domain-containing protein n=1 Tax=Zopfia rhizophila CBS 207.26 TaxID=1314779 RepID=A0A6A6DGU9_9PEZI|nr:hypothetical protein K469DRAFT_603311 [Zopfia rhizophila CBS 207.26]